MHDWFSHGKNETADPWTIPLADDDPWPQHPMEIPRTRRDPSADADGPPTFVTADTHWWDGSQIYGSDPAFAHALRTGEHGKLKLDANGLLPAEIEAHVDLTGVAGNFWVGLALLHTLFMLEHNAICDRLHAEHPELADDDLYDKARLVNAALMAKIHTVDWTPAIIAHPTTVTALRANWWGLLGEGFDEALRPPHRHRGAPRHPRLAEGVARRALRADRGVRRRLPHAPADPRRVCLPLARGRSRAARADIAGDRRAARPRDDRSGAARRRDLFVRDRRIRARSRCTTTRASCRSSSGPDGEVLDLAAWDIVRTRERGVPRYNEFRRLFHLEPVKTFEELTDNAE